MLIGYTISVLVSVFSSFPRMIDPLRMTRPCGAPKTVFTGHDPPVLQCSGHKGPNMIGCTVVHRKTKGKIKITVIKGAVPTDADLASAHQTRYCVRIKRFPEQPHVGSHLSLSDKLFSKAPQGHISDGKQMSKGNSKVLGQFPPVIFFEGKLGRRQKGPPGLYTRLKGNEGSRP